MRGLTAKALEGDPKATAMVLDLIHRVSWAEGRVKAILARED